MSLNLQIPYNISLSEINDMLQVTEKPNPSDSYLTGPVIFSDMEQNVAYLLNSDSSNHIKSYKTNKNFEGSMRGVEQPAFLLVKNLNSDDVVATTNKFILNAWSENRIEKVQILETFKSATLSWFGEKTKVYTFQGVLSEAYRDEAIVTLIEENTDIEHTYLWGQSFRSLWENILSGTKLVENNNICVLSLMNNVLYGYPMGLALNSNSQTPYSIAFSFSFICKEHIILSPKVQDLYNPKNYEVNGPFVSPSVKEAINKVKLDLQQAISDYETAPNELNLRNLELLEEKLKLLYLEIQNGSKEDVYGSDFI